MFIGYKKRIVWNYSHGPIYYIYIFLLDEIYKIYIKVKNKKIDYNYFGGWLCAMTLYGCINSPTVVIVAGQQNLM